MAPCVLVGDPLENWRWAPRQGVPHGPAQHPSIPHGVNSNICRQPWRTPVVTLGGVSVPGAQRGGRWGCLTPGLPPPTTARLVHVPPLGKPLLSLVLRRGGAPGTSWKPQLPGRVLPPGHWFCPVTHWMCRRQHFASFANPGKQGLHLKAMVGLHGVGVQHLSATLSKSGPSLPCPHLTPRVGWQSSAPCLGWQPRGTPPQSQPQLLGRGQEGDTQET